MEMPHPQWTVMRAREMGQSRVYGRNATIAMEEGPTLPSVAAKRTTATCVPPRVNERAF
jgi:hypothetical protein